MMRRKTNKIWQIPLNELKKITAESSSLAVIFRYLNLSTSSANYRVLKQRLAEEKIDYSHISLGIGSNRGRRFPSKAAPLSEVMVKNSTYNRGHLKKRLLKEGLLKNKCNLCGQKPEWQGKELIMVLDHINGDGNDHRKENLRLLCPNCNSQTPTFSGRKNKKYHYCKKCGEKKDRNSELCFKCSVKVNGLKRRKVKNRPSQEQLRKEIEETSYCAVGRKYGVSDKAVRKWLK
jgi:hypothetical protein